jgi:hypothetical protein
MVVQEQVPPGAERREGDGVCAAPSAACGARHGLERGTARHTADPCGDRAGGPSTRTARAKTVVSAGHSEGHSAVDEDRACECETMLNSGGGG